MSSLVDRMRSSGVRTTRVAVLGIDPDLDTTGWSLVRGSFTTPVTGPAVIDEAYLGMIRIQKRPGMPELEQAEEMVKALTSSGLMAHEGLSALFVEAQQVYPPRHDETVGQVVAKANDLLRLAQITGAAQAMARAHNLAMVRAVLPVTWKGQKEKPVTAANCIDRLVALHSKVAIEGKEGLRFIDAVALRSLPVSQGHAMDALGIAMWGLDYLARNQ